ncbi:MAG: O-antigen ligase family protein [Flavobacteriales bacterium]
MRNKFVFLRIAQELQFWACVVIVVAMPFSNLFMSLGMFILAGSVILQNMLADRPSNWKDLLRENMKRLAIIPMLGLFFLLLLSLIYTEHFDYALWDLKMKLPIFVLPVAFLFGKPFDELQRQRILGCFILSTAVACTLCIASYIVAPSKLNHDARQISIFISHIRFSMMLILASVLLFTSAWHKPFGKVLTIMLLTLFGAFIYLSSSLTGAVLVFGMLAWATIFWFSNKSASQKLRFGVLTFFLLLSGCGVYWVVDSFKDYFNAQPLCTQTHSAGGELYADYHDYPLIENGHFVMEGIAWSELYREWSRKSNISPDSLDGGGHLLKGTLIRYLGNKGLLKDSVGISMLTPLDISNIESGMTHPYLHHGIDGRLNKVWFEWSNYKAGGNTSGHSILQRIEFIRTALLIIGEHPVWGVGIGDVAKSFACKYEEIGSSLDQKHRLRAHNQYLTMWISAGFFGLVAFAYWLWKNLKSPSWLPQAKNALFMIAVLSFITEDTLETVAGVVFISFFLAFFADTIPPSAASQLPAK